MKIQRWKSWPIMMVSLKHLRKKNRGLNLHNVEPKAVRGLSRILWKTREALWEFFPFLGLVIMLMIYWQAVRYFESNATYENSVTKLRLGKRFVDTFFITLVYTAIVILWVRG